MHAKVHVMDQLFSICVLQFADIPGSRTFGAADHIETDPVALGQGFKTLPPESPNDAQKDPCRPPCSIKPNPF